MFKKYNDIIPMYYQIAKYYEKKIRLREILPGEALPTESEISTQFGVSRMTVRRAISELASEGMVYTQQGKGTFVAKPKLDNVIFDLNNFYKEIIQKGMKPHAKLLEVKIIKPDDILVKKIKLTPNAKCLFFRIVISADNEPLAYETKYTIYEKQSPILESEIKDPSLSNLAAVHTDSLPTSSKRILKVSKTTEEESMILGVSIDTPVFLLEQVIYDSEQRPIAWGKSIYRGDRYSLKSYDGWDTEI